MSRHTAVEDPEGVRALHVDDDRKFVDMCAQFIERIDDGFSVTTETAVDDALRRLDGEPFDCVISDYQMPEQDGLDFLEAVRRQHQNLPFILFTGQGSEEIASEAISKGVTDYLQKQPGTDQFDLLVNRVRNAVDAYRTEQELMTTLSWYQRLVEQNLAGMYLIQQNEFVYVNQRLSDVFGYSQEELIGESPTKVVDADDHELLLENLRRREEGEVESLQYSLRGERKDGSAVEFEVHGGTIEFEGQPAVMGLLIER